MVNLDVIYNVTNSTVVNSNVKSTGHSDKVFTRVSRTVNVCCYEAAFTQFIYRIPKVDIEGPKFPFDNLLEEDFVTHFSRVTVPIKAK